jgi:hypothetical protein
VTVLFGPYLAAAALLAVAGAAKAARPYDTARALAAGVPGWPARGGAVVVRVGAGVEAALGLVALAWPARPVAAAVAVSYAIFAGFVVFARARGGPLATCGCFGSPDTPPTILHVVVNLVATGAGGAVAAAGLHGASTVVLGHSYAHGVPLAIAAALTAWLAYLALVPLARLGDLRALPPTGRRT